jgi:diguanylate cyclase (GGDEF)-like protein/PAS domain S-box-containing protein
MVRGGTLKLDIQTLAFASGFVSLACGLIIASHGAQRERVAQYVAFALSAVFVGVAHLIALIGAEDGLPWMVIAGNVSMLLGALCLHAALYLRDAKTPPYPAYGAATLALVVGYVSVYQFEFSVNERIAIASMIRIPIYAHAAWLIAKERQVSRSRGLAGLQLIASAVTVVLVLRMIAAFNFVALNIELASQLWWQSVYFLLMGLASVGTAVAVVYLDGEAMTARLTQEVTAKTRALAAREAELRLIFETSYGAIFFVNMDGLVTAANRRMAQMFGRDLTQLIGSDYVGFIHPDEREAGRELMIDLLQGKTEVVSVERRYVRPDGSDFWGHLSGRCLFDEERKSLGLVGVIIDVTERRRSEAHVAFLAHHDHLTGLPNRLLIEDRVQRSMALSVRNHTKTALLFLDLDGFKTVNDSLGHIAGDQVLKEIANRLCAVVRDADRVSRHGGDEFLVILPSIRDHGAVVAVVEKILDTLSKVLVIDGYEVCLSSSIGIAVSPDDGEDFEDLMRKADAAMYQAKEAGRNTYRFYSQKLEIDAIAQLDLKSGLRRALDDNAFELEYQPVFDIATNRLVSVAALVRWRRPGHGLVPAEQFLSIAERSGLIVPLAQWSLREACLQARSWQLSGLAVPTVTVALSAAQFKRGDLEKTVLAALDDAGLPPDRLELTLRESLLAEDGEQVAAAVRRLREWGIRFAVTDFGTGYASLTYLKRLDVDRVILDRGSIERLRSHADDARVVAGIIGLAAGLGVPLGAEGVDTAEDLEILRERGCRLIQGLVLAAPMTGEQLGAFVLTRTTGRSGG